MNSVTDALMARQQAPKPSEHWWSPIVDALTGGPSWSDQASQLRQMQQQGAPLEDRMALASGLVGGFGGSIRAFHGSPHVFAPEPGFPMGRFKDEAIGSGEGQQAFGYGHYFAENPSVADKGYREPLSQADAVKVKVGDKVDHPGNLADELWPEASSKPLPSDPENYQLHESHRAYSGWLQAFYDMADKKGILTPKTALNPKDDFDAGYLAARDTLRSKDATHVTPGALYEVNLAPDPEDLLHWDKPLSEQPAKVREALGKLDIKPTPHTPFTPQADPTGQDLYQMLANMVQKRDRRGIGFKGSGKQSEVDASAALRDAGIPGIRYLDAGSRSAGEGSHNVVLFDPSQAQIVSRNGQPVTDALMGRGGFRSFAESGLTDGQAPPGMVPAVRVRGEVFTGKSHADAAYDAVLKHGAAGDKEFNDNPEAVLGYAPASARQP